MSLAIYGRSGRSAYGGQCRELRQACLHKEELGEEGLGNCQRYRQGLLSPCNPTFPRGIARCPLSLMTSPSPGLVGAAAETRSRVGLRRLCPEPANRGRVPDRAKAC
jgi:hypothetical protein